MNLELSDEQLMLREAAGNALARHETVAAAREARDGAAPLDLWPVAREAGWSGLLVEEEHGGAGLGLYDAMLVMSECGRRLANADLLGHLPATVVLSRGSVREPLADAASGVRRAAIVHARTGTFQMEIADRVPRLNGVVSHVPDLAGAEILVVAGETADGELHALLLDAAGAGVEVEHLVRGDASRPLGKLTLLDAEARALEAGADAFEEAWDVAQALLAAEALGVCEAMLEMAVAYAKDRHAFGRPIGSYQAIKQQIVEILRHTEKLRSLCVYAGLAAEDLPEELSLAAAAARLAGEEAADYATRTCIAVHGGIGATWEHDAPFYWRRAQLSRLLLGGQAGASDRVADQVIAAAAA